MTLHSSTARAQGEAERAGARAAANQGMDAFEAKQWVEAEDLFKRAESLVHSPVHLLFLARSQVQLGKLVEAYEAYAKAARQPVAADAPPAFGEAKSDAGKELAQIEPRLAFATIKVEGAGKDPVEVTVDGNAFPSALIGVASPMNPGKHEFKATSRGLASQASQIDFTEGKKLKVVLKLEPTGEKVPESAAPPPGDASKQAGADQGPTTEEGKSAPIPAYVALGVGVVGLGLGTVFAISSAGKRSDADALCKEQGGACDSALKSKIDDLDSQANSAGTLSVASFAVGAIGVGVGVTLLMMSGGSSEKPPETKAFVSPWIGLGSAGLRGRF